MSSLSHFIDSYCDTTAMNKYIWAHRLRRCVACCMRPVPEYHQVLGTHLGTRSTASSPYLKPLIPFLLYLVNSVTLLPLLGFGYLAHQSEPLGFAGITAIPSLPLFLLFIFCGPRCLASTKDVRNLTRCKSCTQARTIPGSI